MRQLSARTERARLRPARLDDIDALKSAGGNSEYWKEAGFASWATYKTLIESTVTGQVRLGTGIPTCLWVIEGCNGKPIGMAYLGTTLAGFADGLAGVFLEEHRGTREALDGICCAIDLGFSHLGYRHITATVRPDNPRALRFWMKLGFRAEGVVPSEPAPFGAPSIEVVIGITPREFLSSPVVREVINRRILEDRADTSELD